VDCSLPTAFRRLTSGPRTHPGLRRRSASPEPGTAVADPGEIVSPSAILSLARRCHPGSHLRSVCCTAACRRGQRHKSPDHSGRRRQCVARHSPGRSVPVALYVSHGPGFEWAPDAADRSAARGAAGQRPLLVNPDRRPAADCVTDARKPRRHVPSLIHFQSEMDAGVRVPNPSTDAGS
jgi:hypothetical protein